MSGTCLQILYVIQVYNLYVQTAARDILFGGELAVACNIH